MVKRTVIILALLSLVGAACGSGTKKAALPQPVTIQVDAKSDALSMIAFTFSPDTVKVHPGDSVRFHSNFRGEAHTVALGSKIDAALKIFDTLTPKQQRFEEPPPPAKQKKFDALKIPFFFPEEEEEFAPEKIKLNQAAAQRCILTTGDAPESGPCPKVSQPAFTGAEGLFNSGWLADDETFTVKLAPTIAVGTYNFFCLVHGPEMRGKIDVVPKTQAAETAAQAAAAGAAKIDELVQKLQPEIDKTASKLEANTVQAGQDVEGVDGGATVFTPRDVSIPVGGSITWTGLDFHTVSFNAPEDARPLFVRNADGSVVLNQKTFAPAQSPTPPKPKGPPQEGKEPPPLHMDGGSWDGTGYLSSGVVLTPASEITYKLTFTQAGTYKYECLVHPDMEGTVKVG